jgi:hypothetical protein
MDRQQMQRCLEQVAAYRASGQTAQAWAEANDVPLRTIASWCGHARRWQAKLDGVSAAAVTPSKGSGFVAARVAPTAASASIRVELDAGTTRLQMHWPLAHARELAALLREIGR